MKLSNKCYDYLVHNKTEGVSRSEAIVFKIIKDLRNRKGIGDEYDMIDTDIQEEIMSDWIAITDTTVGKDE